MKIAIATGTRADWGLLQPPARALRSMGADILIMATHQHLMPAMGNTIQEIRDDGFEPAAIFPAKGTAPEIMAMAAAGASRALTDLRPDALLLLGDRCEMLGIASAALLSGVPIIHIAGGTVSEGAFDDSVRHAITKMATLHFPETRLCAERIIRMGEDPERVRAVGAIGVENSIKVKRMTRCQLAESLEGWDPGEKFLVVTLHAATLEEVSPLEVQENLLRALAKMPEDFRFILTYPNSDIDPQPLIESLRRFEKDMGDRVKVVPSLGRRRYLSAAALSSGIVGNSSSALVETPSLGIGSLNIGQRQKGRECGEAVIHCGVSEDEIGSGLKRLISPDFRQLAAAAENPYAGHDTVNRIATEILSFPFHPFPQKHFFS
ncbi:MAG: UDP-N-acetylglucosamine 2-epimerase (hydrolyzing) [Muribaculaceae bacterium]|nr:UDP-N-acetylglucosamine 2-epimerase (hydrolyzing) [Muribaculaceae bacterium]